MTPEPSTPDTTGLRLPFQGMRWDGSCFWVIHRRREFGPFDYEWSHDLRGVTLLYRGTKFGEICNELEFFADLKEFGLPRCVSAVASVTLGCISYSILHGLSSNEKQRLIAFRLTEQGYGAFAQVAS